MLDMCIVCGVDGCHIVRHIIHCYKIDRKHCPKIIYYETIFLNYSQTKQYSVQYEYWMFKEGEKNLMQNSY